MVGDFLNVNAVMAGIKEVGWGFWRELHGRMRKRSTNEYANSFGV